MESAIYAEFAQSLSQITYMVEDLEGRSLLDGLLSEKIIWLCLVYAMQSHIAAE